MFSKILTLLYSVVCFSAGCTAFGKPHKMLMLNLAASGGPKPQLGRTCRGAAEYVLETVNNHSDLLPDYELTMEYKYEGDDGSMAAQAFALFARSFEQGDNNRTIDAYQSPITVGPFISSGCASMGKLIHHVDMVTIAAGCSATALGNRVIYPNLYLMIQAFPIMVMAIQFIKSAANWQTFGILTNPVNPVDYTAASWSVGIAESVGLNVTYFNVVLEPSDEVMISIKQSRSRILMISHSDSNFLLPFFCRSHKFGITGARYVFIMNVVAFVDPAMLPEVLYPGCNRSQILEQYKYTFFASGVPRTSPGQAENVIKYDAWIDKYLNYTKPGDYYLFKYICHDTYMRAVVALDSAERALNLRNMSLRDYGKDPALVMRYVNESAANTNYTGYPLAPLKFNDGTSWPGAICHFTRSKGFVYDYRIVQLPDTRSDNFWSYRLLPIMKMDWEAYGGQAPRGGPISVSETTDMSFSLSVVVFCLAGVDILIKISGLSLNVHFWLRKPHSATGNSGNRISVYFPVMKTIGYIACLHLDIAAILFSLNIERQFLYSLTIARICMLVAGISAVNAVQALRVLLLERSLSAIQWPDAVEGRRVVIVPHEHASISVGHTNSVIVALTPDILRLEIKNTDRIAARWSMIFTAIYLIVTLIWLTCDPFRCFQETLPTVYIEESDTELTTSEYVCRSEKQLVWMIVMWLSQMILFPLALFSGYRLRHRFPSCPEHKTMRIGLNNSMATQMAVVVILFILQRNQVWLFTTLSFGCLALSLLSSLSWSFPVLTRLFKMRTHTDDNDSASSIRSHPRAG